MDKGYEKEPFRTIGIKTSVLKKFKGFSKRQGKSHSMTLLAMVEFFDHNGISPDERMHETIESLKYLIKRRFNAMVAIMRSIEKEQTLPTVSMIQALFQQELESEDGEEWEGDFEFFEKQLTEISTNFWGNLFGFDWGSEFFASIIELGTIGFIVLLKFKLYRRATSFTLRLFTG